MSTQNGCSLATFLVDTESRNAQAISKKHMAVMASDAPAHNFPSLRLGLIVPQPSTCRHAQSLLGSSFHDQRTHHVLESHPEQAAPLFRRDDAQRHAVGSHSALALPLSCSLQTLLRLSLLSLRPSLLQFVSIVSLLLNHRNPILEPVCVF